VGGELKYMAMFMKGSVCDSKFDRIKGKQISYSYTRMAVKPEILEQNQKNYKKMYFQGGRGHQNYREVFKGRMYSS